MKHRTHTNGQLNRAHVGQTVSLCGWAATLRDHGGVNFVDLRDRWGVTQVVFRPEPDKDLHARARELRPEYCVRVTGKVTPRPEGTVNTKLPTGEIEVEVQSLEVFSRSKTPPFEMEGNQAISEEVRLKHRYLDLRRSATQEPLFFRSRLINAIRQHLTGREFIEVETPILCKSTPEGARDYLVPSRLNHGEFFALPQSPQLFKQLLMVSGFERYFQIAKCFRDEDLRADRQPEFTQLDLEMSFVNEEDIFEVIESMMAEVFEKAAGQKLTTPFPRLSYADAMARFGSDKPDLRFALEIRDASEVFAETGLKIFKQTLDGGGVILALKAPGAGGRFSRKDFDDMVTFAKSQGAAGLAYLKWTAAGIESPIAKFLKAEEIARLGELLPEGVKEGDAVFFAADKKRPAQLLLGAVRLELARRLGMRPQGGISLAWIHEFPLLQLNAEDGKWNSEHHPFTGIHPEDTGLLGVDNGAIRSLSYDLVLNGNEIASGSIRIHDAVLQEKVFETIGLDPEECRKRFGFLLKAFEYGPPPHGGIAIGLDRLTAILTNRESIRDVIAFPKTQKAICPLTQAPSEVDPVQLKDLGLKIA
ncbi:MAG: aspartate--tRNA ligase [Candidatus Omnitrophica bacterium]|nr:aspartate--tRNA ligase [Candidatus Omnitrophota bacterium]